jgi:hypothetical protein
MLEWPVTALVTKSERSDYGSNPRRVGITQTTFTLTEKAVAQFERGRSWFVSGRTFQLCQIRQSKSHKPPSLKTSVISTGAGASARVDWRNLLFANT